jgi:hypothetical protein
MDARPALQVAPDGYLHELMVSARGSVAARMSDPYLTDHDRWVLQRFGDFLAAVTLAPDRRAISRQSERGLHRDAGSRNVRGTRGRPVDGASRRI